MKGHELSVSIIDDKTVLSFIADDDSEAYELVDRYRDKEISVDIKQYRNKRSLDANGYFWVLCGKVANSLIKGGSDTSKEEIYRDYVKAMGGNFEALNVRNNAVASFCEQWERGGLGSVTQVLESGNDSYKTVLAFYGSSTYTTEQMSTLINLVQADCKELGIETATPEEIERLLSLWNPKA